MSAATLHPSPRVRLFGQASTTGLLLMGFWILIGIGLVAALALSIDAERLSRYGWPIIHGFFTTIRLCVISLVAGAVISLPIAAGRLSKNPFIGALAYAYSYFFRGTPVIAQLFLVYYGAGQFVSAFRAIGLWWFFRDAFNCAVFAFAINTAAYQAEILFGAIRSVPKGSWEASQALGLSRLTTLRKIILPQALITALRPYGNEMISVVKASAVTSLVTVLDLMGETRYVFSQTYDLSFYLWAAVFYLIIVEGLRRTLNAIERRLTRHLALPTQAETPVGQH